MSKLMKLVYSSQHGFCFLFLCIGLILAVTKFCGRVHSRIIIYEIKPKYLEAHSAYLFKNALRMPSGPGNLFVSRFSNMFNMLLSEITTSDIEGMETLRIGKIPFLLCKQI